MIVAGIDPGKSGAVAVAYYDLRRFYVRSLVFDTDGILDLHKLVSDIAPAKDTSNPIPDHVYIEAVHGRGGWSATANYTFGSVNGQILSCLRHHVCRPVSMIQPQKWQRSFFQEKDKGTKPKEKSLAYALGVFPDEANKLVGKNHNKIDALLIATYGLQSILGLEINPKDWQFVGETETKRKNHAGGLRKSNRPLLQRDEV